MQILWNNFLGLGEAVASLLLLIDSVIYWLISELYGLYVILAQATIFKDELYVDIANKVYLVMGVVALFIVVYVLLQSIVNPDNFRKSGMDFVKKFVIAIIMIILTPAIFNFLYEVQDAILDDNIIENIFLGNNNTSSSVVYATYFYDTNNPNLTSEEIMAKIEDESNTEYSADKFVLDEDGESTERFLIRYIVTEDCTETNYKTAMKNCEKVDVNNLDEENNKLIKQYGNDMALTVLEAFLHPDYDSGMTDSTTIVNAANAAGVSSGKSKAGWIGCGFSAAGAIIIGAVGTAAGVITWGAGSGVTVASIGTAAGIVVAACGGGYLAGGEVYEAVNYEEYTWTMAKNEILSDGKFNVITAFAGDGNEGNQGIIGGEMSYTPIVSTICGAVLLYMIFGFCLDLGLRAAKLAFYQMLAPVTFLLNILPGQKDLLTNWIKLVLTTWGEVFVRIFTMIAVVYLFSSLDMLTLENTYGIVAKAIIVMGLVMFVKQFPKLLGDVTGIKSENMKLGIKDKLNAGTFGLAGGVAGFATGALGGAIAAKRYGGSFMGGLASGAVGGFQGKGNQWKKQANKQYSTLTGDHKGKVGIFGGKTIGTRITNQANAMNKRSQNIATVDRNDRIAENKEALKSLEAEWANTNVAEKQRIADFEASREYQTVYNHVQSDESVQKAIEKAKREWDIDNVSSAKKMTAEDYALKRDVAFKEITENKLRIATRDYMRKYYSQGGAGYTDYQTDNNQTAQYLRDLDKNSVSEKQYNYKKSTIQKAIKKDEKIQSDLGEKQANDEFVKKFNEMFKKSGLDKEFKKDDKK